MPTTSEEKVTRDSAVVPFQTPNLNPVRLDAVAAKRSGPETTGFKKRNALVVCIAILRSQGVGGTIRAGAYLHNELNFCLVGEICGSQIRSNGRRKLRPVQPANPIWDSAASAFPDRSQFPFELVCPLW